MEREKGLELFMDIKKKLSKRKRWSRFIKDIQDHLEPGNSPDSSEIEMEALMYILERYDIKLTD
jgi:hypothetical protein